MTLLHDGLALSGCHTGQLGHQKPILPLARSYVRRKECETGALRRWCTPFSRRSRSPADHAQRRPVARQKRVDENIGPPECADAERVVVTDRHWRPWSALARPGSNESARCTGATPLHHGSPGRDSAAAPARAQAAHEGWLFRLCSTPRTQVRAGSKRCGTRREPAAPVGAWDALPQRARS
jgi:hypothetical protein